LEDTIEQDKESLTTDQITGMCRRGFGANLHIESIQELSGGTFNTTYLITFADASEVILRVSPPQTGNTPCYAFKAK
jgi:hypothetical protein